MVPSMPDPMMRADEKHRTEVHAHDHAVCIYGTHDELVAPLAHFIEQGLERKELTVFVHSFPRDEEAWEFLERAKPGARRLSDERLVLVSLYKQAFEGEGARIDHEHVERVVGGLLENSRRDGRHGLRIFVDASRVYFRDQRAAEWFQFESWLGRRLLPGAGLVCAYRRADATRPDLLPEMLRTHAYRFDAP